MTILIKLFIAFFEIGLFSVGGGYAAIPLIQAQIVDRFGLMTLSEFSDLITIAEMTPGPLSINASTFVGIKASGLFGAVICTFACIVPSIMICLILAHFYYKYRTLNAIQILLASLRPAVVSLIGSAGISILILALFNSTIQNLHMNNFNIIELIIFLISIFLLRKYKNKVSAIAIILGSGTAGTLLYFLKNIIF